MTQTKKTEPASKTDSAKDAAFKATEATGRFVSACTNSAAELSIGTAKVFSNLFIGIAESFAENISKAATDSADTAQRSVDRFFTGLKTDSGTTKDEATSTTQASPAGGH